MIPFEALQTVSRARGATGYSLHDDEPAPDVHVLVCALCTQALIADLRRLFPRSIGLHTLHGSLIMGCTFGDGSPEQCALHSLMQEEAPCR